MLLDSIYTNFVKNTGLSAGIYKSIFAKINDVLEKVNFIKWEKLVYSNGSADEVVVNLNNTQVPQYQIEIILNLFYNFYTFPKNFNAKLYLTFNNIEYIITYDNEKDVAIIPDEISFIKEYNLFELFTLLRPVYDVFSEFDRLFKFTEIFKTKINKVYPDLQKKFEEDLAVTNVITGEVKKSNIPEKEAFLENLINTRTEILGELDEIRTKLDKAVENKNTVHFYLKSKNGVSFEKDKLQDELNLLQDAYNDYKTRYDDTNNLIQDIDKEITNLVDFENIEDSTEVDVLKEKKNIFKKSLEQYNNNMLSTKKLIDITQGRLNEIASQFNLTKEYTQADEDTLLKQIEDLEKYQDILYGKLMSVDGEIKNTKSIISNNTINYEKAKLASNNSFDTSELTSIVDHITTPEKPNAVVTVLNYLRYYFAYMATISCSELEKINPNIDVTILQSIACRSVLTNEFGLYFNNCFSIFNFSDERHKKVTLAVRD